ncbi:nose resistant to fluoxetine protein 6 [Elysia marginata]|uniref:Nose resistant to fluoxetine protein 6 n=1 Tax=Elysia marginata TaxID=1093978 RepID=A0AAV4EGN3_9GAST|nr:nose resistant to fluoxetine protein 6 [Elysia marginata]
MADVRERLLKKLMKRKLKYARHIMRIQSGTVVNSNSTTNPTISEEAKSRSRRNEKHELSPPATISVNPTTASLSKTWKLLRQVSPQSGYAILNGQPLTPQQKKGLADFAKQLGSSISQLPNLLQEGGNSTLDLLKFLRDSGLLRALTGSNTPGDPTSEPYTVDWLKCKNDLRMMANGISTRQMWALQMLDSWGKPEPSILKGNTAFLGNNAECRGVHYTNNKTFANVLGNMCRMSIYLEATRGVAISGGAIPAVLFSSGSGVGLSCPVTMRQALFNSASTFFAWHDMAHTAEEHSAVE